MMGTSKKGPADPKGFICPGKVEGSWTSASPRSPQQEQTCKISYKTVKHLHVLSQPATALMAHLWPG